jgi:hypothetical protein
MGMAYFIGGKGEKGKRRIKEREKGRGKKS